MPGSGRFRAAAALIHSPAVRLGTGRVLALWDIALYRGFLCALYATAGWVSLLVLQAVVRDPFVLLGLLAGPVLEFGIERGREWLKRYEAEDYPGPAAGSQGGATNGRIELAALPGAWFRDLRAHRGRRHHGLGFRPPGRNRV